MKIIATISTDFKEKFGIPRQSGLVGDTVGRIRFLPPYDRPEALRGIEGYSHLWLIFEFSRSVREDWTPTVRPPRLGGNRRVGVFATRSPFRPNPIGLSSVRLLGVTEEAGSPVLLVAGADLLDGTPIYDIKPYLAYTDSHPDAVCGFSEEVFSHVLSVDFPPTLLATVEEAHRAALLAILAQDPRPSYQDDPARIYFLTYASYELSFRVAAGVLTVLFVSAKHNA